MIPNVSYVLGFHQDFWGGTVLEYVLLSITRVISAYKYTIPCQYVQNPASAPATDAA